MYNIFNERLYGDERCGESRLWVESIVYHHEIVYHLLVVSVVVRHRAMVRVWTIHCMRMVLVELGS